MKKIIGVIAAVIIAVTFLTTRDKESLVSKYGLDHFTPREMVNHFEYSKDIEEGLDVAITSEHIVLMSNNKEQKVSLKDEAFYLSIAPYVTNTHPCDNHVPTSCQGELGLREFNVKAVGSDGTVYYDDAIASARNGFFGLWLPRNQDIIITIDSAYGSSTQLVSTTKNAPTCLTTMELS